MFTLIAHRHRRRRSATASSRRSRPALFPAAFRGHGGAVPVYFEAAAVIIVAGAARPGAGAARARAAPAAPSSALLGLAPKTARRIDADGARGTTCRSTRVQRRRPAARPPRREGAGRRRRARGPQRASTNRWSPASRCRSTQDDRRQGDRRAR
ncbi:MAG: hypothetical protein MZV49_24710 [Rhodopseudomonas palustris]|nr:hypothetical protein [Rhodopseudomonas palustris]